MIFLTYLLRGYTLAFKATSYLLIGSLAIMIVFSGVSEAAPMGLKQNSVVVDDTIKLGDIFYGLARDEDRVLGPAPRPGQDMVLGARTLLRIAMATDLPWRPSNATDSIVLTRDGTVIDQDMIESQIRDTLKSEGLNGQYDITFKSSIYDIVLPPSMDATMDVIDMDLRHDKNSFEATLVAPSKDNPVQRVRVSGQIQRLISIPVIRETLRNGTIISMRDIDMIEIPEKQLKHNTILNAENLIGMTPRRMTSPGQPVQTGDIEAPVIVKRGEVVTMLYNSGPLQLSARGKALENGAKGDIIRIVNTGSSKSIEAEVTNTREVRVATF